MLSDLVVPSNFRPPYSYFLDIFWVFLRAKRGCDVGISMSTHLTFILIVLRKIGKIKKVIHINIDFSPHRFNSAWLSRIYKFLDRYCFVNSDLQFDMTEDSLKGRASLLEIQPKMNKNLVFPVPSYFRFKSPVNSFDEKRIVFCGSFNDECDIESLLESFAFVSKRFPLLTMDIIGQGLHQKETEVERYVQRFFPRIVFHGVVDTPDSILKSASVAIAPYQLTEDSFTRFANSGKLNLYMSRCIPMVSTNISSFTEVLAEFGALSVYDGTVADLSTKVTELLMNRDYWNYRRSRIARFRAEERLRLESMDSFKQLRAICQTP
jgi:glycosyltransferase involved in cell wall biosynthesis